MSSSKINPDGSIEMTMRWRPIEIEDDRPQCVQCQKHGSSSDTWQPGEFCLFGMLFACSRECGEKYARENAREGYRPGEPNFDLVEVEPAE